MTLSPLASLVLQHHRGRPAEAMYDLAAFGSSYREVYLHLDPSDFARLDAAYKELEDAGLLEKTEQVGRIGKQFFYYYQLAPGAAVPAGASR